MITVELLGQVPRAYPIRYLMWHEIVNAVTGDVPIAVTFCPLCNSGVTLDRRLKKAWPLERLKTRTEITKVGVKITWKAGTSSALDSS